jgi:hypothetical protein
MKSKEIPYAVIDHHSMWGWKNHQITPEEADVVFVWNDFEREKEVKNWQKRGKKVVVFEHGWNSFFDYELNNKPHIADGYMALGANSKKSLIRSGVPEDKILISGNKNFDHLKSSPQENLIPKVLYTTLHWFSDRRDFNNRKLDSIIKSLGSYSDIYVKTMINSKIDIREELRGEWFTDIYENKTLFSDMAKNLSKYDIILTPKESTFDFIALLVGKRVFRIAEQSEYRTPSDPKTRNILPLSKISTDLLFNESEILVDMKDELAKSSNINEILKWVKNL